jgi:hypothetical protein
MTDFETTGFNDGIDLSKAIDPKTFDVDAWLTGAKLPEHSVEVYARGDLLAQADDLIRRIGQAEKDEDLERALGEGESPSALREQYERVVEQFKDSALTVRVRALDPSESGPIQTAVEEKRIPAEEQILHEIAAAAIEPALTVEQLRVMQKRIGPAQVKKIWNAVFRATGEQPEVSPAFLPRRSGQGTGQE